MNIERSGMEWICWSNEGLLTNQVDFQVVECQVLKIVYQVLQNKSSSSSGSGMTSTRSARMEETSMNEIKSIKQYSKLISIQLSGMKHINRPFEDLEYLNTINIQYSEILSNVTERGYQKLLFSEPMDVRFGKSTFCHFESFHYYFALSISRNHHLFLQVQLHRV